MDVNDKKYCVYIHTNDANGKMYVGITSQCPIKRWRNGFGYLDKRKNGDYVQPAFARAILKYGWDEFRHEIIYDNLTKDEAKKYEQWLIYLGNTNNREFGYNTTSGGDTPSPLCHTDEWKRQHSERMMGKNNPNYGKHISDAQKAAISEAHKGKTTWIKGRGHSEETKQKLRDILKGKVPSGENHYMFGKHQTEETKRKNSDAHKKIYANLTDDEKIVLIENQKTRKLVVCIETGIIYRSLREAERKTGAFRHQIASCCKESYRTAGGYHWRFATEEEVTML